MLFSLKLSQRKRKDGSTQSSLRDMDFGLISSPMPKRIFFFLSIWTQPHLKKIQFLFTVEKSRFSIIQPDDVMEFQSSFLYDLEIFFREKKKDFFSYFRRDKFCVYTYTSNNKIGKRGNKIFCCEIINPKDYILIWQKS